MRQKMGRMKKQAVLAGLTCAWLAGLMMAGSDNPLMPWPNIVGLGLFMISSLFIGRAVHRSAVCPPVSAKRTQPSVNRRRPLIWRQPEKQVLPCVQGV